MDEKINRLTIIKTIGWTTFIIFGFVFLWIIFQIIGTVIFDNSVSQMIAGQEEFNGVATEIINAVNKMRVILFLASGLTLLTAIGAFGLLKLKNWGLVMYQSLTIVMIIFLLDGLFYYVFSVMTQMQQQNVHSLDLGMTENFRVAQIYTTTGYAIFVLLFSWILTRANIFLSAKENRNEFQ